MKQTAAPEVTRITLQVLCIGLLIGGTFWILEFFLPSILWATIIVITTWPAFVWVRKRLWDSRVAAILVMVCALLVVVLLPSAFAVGAIVGNTEKITGWINSVRGMDVPPPPGFLAKLPLVGARATAAWQKAETLTAEGVSNHLAPYTGAVVAWFISKAGSVGLLLMNFLLTIAIAVVLYANGESAAAKVRAFCHRLAGARGDEVATLAAKATRSVALGVIVTALVQAVLSGIGLALAGIPSSVLLTAIVFVSCLCQVGPGVVLVPTVVWLFWRGEMFPAGVLLAFSLVVLPLDNFLRPVLIRKGANMPLILVFIGVIGGLLALGVIGLFIGPVILAVTNTLLESWIRSGTDGEALEKTTESFVASR
jgi:predicted PurR-regulated permease PerM